MEVSTRSRGMFFAQYDSSERKRWMSATSRRCLSVLISTIEFARMIVNESLLDRAREHAVRFLHSLPTRHVGPTATRDELLRGVQVPLTDDGEDPAAVLDALAA